MTFQEIFDNEGLYKANGFAKGFCFKVDKDGFLYWVQYKSKDDILPEIEKLVVYKGLFYKEYTKVLNRNQLFE